MKQILYVLAGVFIGFFLAGAIFLVSRLPGGEPVPLMPAPTKEPIVIQVTGAVVRPGVYELPEGSRVQDAFDAAGGLLTEADVKAINLASLLEDGQKLEAPYLSGYEPTPAPIPSSSGSSSGSPGSSSGSSGSSGSPGSSSGSSGSSSGSSGPDSSGSSSGPPDTSGSSGSSGSSGPPDMSGSSGPPVSSSEKININTATLEELDTLPGIGPTTAQKIIDYRTTNGPFFRIEDIMNVSGIGPATFDDIKDLITVE